MRLEISKPVVARVLAALALAAAMLPAAAESCANAAEMDAATRAALEASALQMFDNAAHNNSAALQQSAITSLAANFAGIQAAVAQSQPALGGATASIRATYLLESGGSGVLPRAEFLCGVWGTQQFVSFTLPNLPAGRYAVVITDAKGPKGPYYASFVLQQEQTSGPWKLAGFPAPSAALMQGHDAPWYLAQARELRAKGQTDLAWLNYQTARALAAPVAFMSTTALLKLQREMQSAAPADLPVNGPVTLAAANGQSYSLTQVFSVAGDDGMDLVVKYSVPDVSDAAKAFADNMAVIKAMVARHPEFRQSFQGIVARATAPNGQDYGTLLAMKDIP